jgi:hypothetical protein
MPKPFLLNRSPTDSLESYNNLAKKEAQMLRRNPRKAKYEITWHILIFLDIPELKSIRDKVFDYLRKAGINAVACIEPTRDGFGNPNDTVHFHILTDDERGIDYLKDLTRTACLAAGLQDKAVSHAAKNEFDVECRELWDYDGYIKYFTKVDMPEKVHLFIQGSRVQRFYTIGDWYIDDDGNTKQKGESWQEVKRETRAKRYAETKARLQRTEKFIPVRHRKTTWEFPTNHTRLQALLDKETDETLYDWLCALLGKKTVFQTAPPEWLRYTIRYTPLKCNDLLDAIYERLLKTDNMDIVFALEIYHRHRIQ